MSRASADLESEDRASEARGAPADGRRRVQIEAVDPEVDGGLHAAQRILGDTLTISADLIADGHDLLGGEVLLRRPSREASKAPTDEPSDNELGLPLERLASGRYAASVVVDSVGLWQYTVQGWVESFASWQRDFR